MIALMMLKGGKPLKRLVLSAAVGMFSLGASAAGQPKVDRGIAYYPEAIRSAAKGALDGCLLDLRYTDGVTGFPTVVWFHGGGLVKGHRNGVTLFDRTIAVVCVEYRLMSETNAVRGADCITDAAAAVAWTLDHIVEYGGDPKKVFVSGSSAGGYLTMMVGMDPRWLAKFGHKTSELAGLAPSSGQTTSHFNVRKFNGDKRDRWQPVIDEFAPLNYCENWKDIAPIAIICGESPWEMRGRAAENRLLAETLRAMGHKKVWYVSLPYANHPRTYPACIPYIEYLVKGNYPEPIENAVLGSNANAKVK